MRPANMWRQKLFWGQMGRRSYVTPMRLAIRHLSKSVFEDTHPPFARSDAYSRNRSWYLNFSSALVPEVFGVTF